MDEEEIHDGEDCLSSADQPLDLSQSSEMMSLPSGFKLADISITSDITDSEIDNEDTVLGSNICKGFKKDMLCNTQVDTLAATGSVSVHFSTPTVPSGSVGLLRNSDEGKLKFESSSNEQSHADELSTGTAIITSCHINSTVSVASNGEVPAVTSLSLDDVKFALQENCDLLSDRHLLNELLKSIDEKLGQDSAADCTSHIDSLRYSKSLVPPNRDPGPSLGWKSSDSTNIGIGSQNVASGGSNVHSTSDPLFPQKHQISSKTITPFSSVSCIAPSQRCISNDIFSLGTHNSVISQEEAGIQNGHSNLKEIQQELNNGVFASNMLKRLGATDLQEESVSDKNTERHVKFQQPPEKELTPRSLARNGKHALCQQHDVNIVEDITSTTQAQQILMQLSSLRWKLMGWEDVGAMPPVDNRSSLNFVHQLLNKLQVHQLEKKHLEDEIVTTKAMLKKMNDEAYVRQNMYDKRAARLLEADTQLGIIQREWVGTQETMQREMINLASQCNQLKEEKASLKDEADSMRKDIEKLRQIVRHYEKVKLTLEETQDHFAASREETAELAKENYKLNHILQEKQRCLQELEEVKLPQMYQELKVVKNKAIRLDEAHDKLLRTNGHLEDDLHVLQEQHRILLEKIFEEEDMKEKVLKEKVSLEEQVKNLSSQVTATRNELHRHYQAQLEDLMGKKSQSIQEQLNQLEINMKRNLEEQLEVQHKSHQHAYLNLQKGHEKKIRELNSSHGTQTLELQQQLKVLDEENKRLKDQTKGIVTAVSSILGLHQEDSISVYNPAGRQGSKHYEEQCNNFKWKESSRPTSGGSSRGKSSLKSGSRPASGKSARDVPNLGLKSSSSSDSDASVFQEGRQTVRHLVGGSLHMLPCNSNVENGRSGKPWNSRSETMSGLLESDHYRNSHIDNPDREYRSLPDLQSKSSVILNHPTEATDFAWSHRCHNQELRTENSKFRGKTGLEGIRTNPPNKSHQDAQPGSVHPSFTTKIYKASEILQSSDITDDDGGEMSAYNKLQVDQEMARMLQELRMKVTSARASDSEAPTHDTSFDQDPASITLHKLSQVSTLLSRYVTQSQ